MKGDGTELEELLGKEGLALVRGDESFTLETVGEPSCTAGCPAGVDVKAYVSMVREKRYAEAVDIIRRTNPLPSVCGRVCFHPCEGECLYSDAGEAISIRALKKHATEMDASRRPLVGDPFPRTRSERVGVIGSGPSGLAVAADLARMGYGVTVYERLAHAGGMMHMYIPHYRLPRRVLENDLEWIESKGVEFSMGDEAPTLAELRKEHDAVVLAVGTHVSIRLGIEGEDAEGVLDPLDMLYRAKHGGLDSLEGRTIVVGGGNTAIDCARVAARLGSESSIYYRRSDEEMPASEEEVSEARAEGVAIQTLSIPARIITDDGKVTGMEFVRAELGEPDASGRRRPVPVEGSNFTVEADFVLPAIGQRPDADKAEALGLEVEPRGTAKVDDRYMTSVEGVFAAGDLVTGPTSVVDTIGHAHKVAMGIHAFLRGMEHAPAAGPVNQFEVMGPADAVAAGVAGPVTEPPATRMDPPLKPPETRQGLTDEVEHNYAEWHAVSEAARCHRCGSCYECEVCLPGCPTGQVYMEAGDRGSIVKVPTEFPEDLDGDWSVRTDSGASVPVKLHPMSACVDAERCIGCGRCEDVCPYDVARVGFTLDAAPVSHIDPGTCRGCGVCVGACPTGAIHHGAFSTPTLNARVARAALEGPGAVAIICHWGLGHPTFGAGERDGTVDVQSVAGISPALVTHALASGARGVLIIQCQPGDIHFLQGEADPEELVENLKTFLRKSGLGAGRVSFAVMDEAGRPAELLARFIRGLDAGGVGPLAVGRAGPPPRGSSPFDRATALVSAGETNDPWAGPRASVVDYVGRAFGAGDLGDWRDSFDSLRKLTGRDDPGEVLEEAADLAGRSGAALRLHSGPSGPWPGDDGRDMPGKGSEGPSGTALAVLCGGDNCDYVCTSFGRLPGIDLTRLPAPAELIGHDAWSNAGRNARARLTTLLREARFAGARTVVSADPDLLSIVRAINRPDGWHEADVEVVDPFTFMFRYLAENGVRVPGGSSGGIWGGGADE